MGGDGSRGACIGLRGSGRQRQEEYGSFAEYLWHWTDGQVVYEKGRTQSELSDRISVNLKRRGMKFVGTTVIYAYLQAVGVIYAHDTGCFLKWNEEEKR